MSLRLRRRDDSAFLIYDQRNSSKLFKMTKTKTAMVLVMIISSCGLIFSMTDAYPTPETESVPDNTKLADNNTRLVITHVVKTIEFEVGLVDDDGLVDENSTDSNATERFYETDIELLNLDLLKEVVNQATGDGNSEGTIESKQSLSQTAIEEKTGGEQVADVSLLRTNQTNS